MTFKKKWFSSKIISSDGYYVNPIGRGTILYGDKTNKIYVSAEWLLGARGPITWALYPDDMRVGSERGEKLQDETLRALIVQRIKDVFEYLGWRLKVS